MRAVDGGLSGRSGKVQMIYVKFHRSQDEVLAAVCDREILGESFSAGDVCLEVSERFYGGDLVSIEKLPEILSNSTVANLMGRGVVERAVDLGFVEEEHVLEVSGIKHAQLILL